MEKRSKGQIKENEVVAWLHSQRERLTITTAENMTKANQPTNKRIRNS